MPEWLPGRQSSRYNQVNEGTPETIELALGPRAVSKLEIKLIRPAGRGMSSNLLCTGEPGSLDESVVLRLRQMEEARLHPESSCEPDASAYRPEPD